MQSFFRAFFGAVVLSVSALSTFTGLAISAPANTAPAKSGPVATTKGSVYTPTVASLKNRTYRTPGPKDYLFYTLKDGWSCIGRSSVHLDDAKIGDLNGDGLMDAAVVISYNGGGTGTYTHLFVLINDGKRLYQSENGFSLHNTDSLSMRLMNRKIALKYRAQKPDDPNLVAPTVWKSKVLKLNIPLMSTVVSKPQPGTEKYESLMPAISQEISNAWKTNRDEFREFEKMTDQEFSDQFSYMHGPRKDFKKPKWVEPAKGSKPVAVDFVLAEYGMASDVELTKSSGIQAYDQNALSSIDTTDFEPIIHKDPNLMANTPKLRLHIRAYFENPVRCEIQKMTMPTIGPVIPE